MRPLPQIVAPDPPIRIGAREARDFAAAIAAERGLRPASPTPATSPRLQPASARPAISSPATPTPATPTPPRIAPPAALRAGDVLIGDAEAGGAVGLSPGALIDGPLLIQGVPGAGKSWTLRRLLEQTSGAIQQIVVDPEGEFGNLCGPLGLARIDAAALDVATVAVAAARLREHRLGALLDVSQLDGERHMQMVAAFLNALIDAPREQWTPALVAIDEAQLFAPFGGHDDVAPATRKASIAALVDLMNRGRKRGLATMVATQRLARLTTSVRAAAQNFLIGFNTLDLDIARAAEMIGWARRRAFDRLPELKPGDFVAVGAAFSRAPEILRVGPVTSAHRGARPALDAPPPVDGASAARLLDVEGLARGSAADAEARGEAMPQPGLRAVRQFIRDPDGARLDQLAASLGVDVGALAAALDLLDRQGAVEFLGHGFERAVRLLAALLPGARP